MLGIFNHLLIDLLRQTSVLSDYYKITHEIDRGSAYLMLLQKRKLANLLLHVSKYVPYYKTRLSHYTTPDFENEPYSILAELPVISKKEIINQRNNFYSIRKRKHIINNTGGSTGEPFRYLVDLRSLSRTKAYDLYFWNKGFNYQFGDRIAVIGGSSLSQANNFKIKVYNKLQSKTFFEGGYISKNRKIENVKQLCNGNFDVIYAYPSALIAYIRVAKDHNIVSKTRLKAITTTSETLSLASREIIEDFFDTKVFDVYGARDGGIVGDECIEHNGCHYNVQDCIVEEYYDSSNKSVPELILTNLESYSMPLIRYKVGDLGRIDNGNCSCFSPLPKIIDFAGRTRDILTFTNGDVLHGSYFNKVFAKFSAVRQYQIVKKGTNIKVIIDTIRNDPEIAKKIKDEFIKTIPTEIHFEIVEDDDFILTTSGKLKSIISLDD